MFILFFYILRSTILPDRCMKAGYIALTFDDGPTSYTSHILEILEKNDVPGTFHFTTQNVNKSNIASKIDEAVDNNHTIGLQLDPSRSYDDMSSADIKEEINKQIDVLSDASGTKIKFVRAPVEDGETNKELYDQLTKKGVIQSHYNVCLYHETDDVDSAEAYVDQLFRQRNPKYDSFIFLLQDEREKDFPIVEYIIKEGKANGYTFVTLDQCLEGYKPGTHVNSKKRAKKSPKFNFLTVFLSFLMMCSFV